MYSREVNGKKIAWIENSPLTAKELRNHKKVAAYIANHIGEAYTIIESGSKVYIGENLPSEYTQSEYTRALLRKNPKTLTAKNKAIGSFGEMIEIATNRRWEKTKHIANKDAKYGVYRYSTAFAFPVKQNNKITNIKSFDAELVILNSSDGKKYLYDIVNIKENTADELDLMKRDQIGGQDAPARRGASKGSIRDSDENVKKYSLEPVEAMCGVTLKAEKTITVFLLYFFIRTAKGGLQNGRIFVLDVRPAPRDRSALQRRGTGGGYCREDRKKRRRYLRRA
jgi:hypothetical protein